MTRTGRLIVTWGLSAYGLATALSVIVIFAASADAFRGMFLIALSLPWSLIAFVGFDAAGIRLGDGPGGEARVVGVCLIGVLLNACLFWVVVWLVARPDRGPAGPGRGGR